MNFIFDACATLINLYQSGFYMLDPIGLRNYVQAWAEKHA